jgi:hypothetical protein
MALHYWFEKIDNYKNVVWVGEKDEVRMNPVTETLIFGAISVGLGEITRSNVDEWAARFRIIEKLQGPFLVKAGGKPWHVSDDDFIAHIGLQVNVGNETRAQWVRRIFTNKQTSITDDFARSFRRAVDKQHDAEEAAAR